jgi:hypothetical protein
MREVKGHPTGFGISENNIIDTSNIAFGPTPRGMPDVRCGRRLASRLWRDQALHVAGKRRTILCYKREVVSACVIRGVPIWCPLSGDWARSWHLPHIWLW